MGDQVDARFGYYHWRLGRLGYYLDIGANSFIHYTPTQDFRLNIKYLLLDGGMVIIRRVTYMLYNAGAHGLIDNTSEAYFVLDATLRECYIIYLYVVSFRGSLHVVYCSSVMG